MPPVSDPPVVPPRPSGAASANGYRSITYFLPTQVHARLKAAWWATRDHVSEAASLAGLAQLALTRLVDQLEMDSNEGRPFPDAPDRAQGSGSAAGGGYTHHSYYLPVALHARLKAAWWGTRDTTSGAGSLSGLVERAFCEAAADLETVYNDGAPFPPAPARARGNSKEAARRQGEWMKEEWARRRETPPAEDLLTTRGPGAAGDAATAGAVSR